MASASAADAHVFPGHVIRVVFLDRDFQKVVSFTSTSCGPSPEWSGLSGDGFIPFLFRLGTDAGPDVFSHRVMGHERRVYAALKFIIFTQFGGLLMLVAIVALYFAHYQNTGTYSFQYEDSCTRRWTLVSHSGSCSVFRGLCGKAARGSVSSVVA